MPGNSLKLCPKILNQDFSNEREKPRKGGLYEVRDDFDVKNALGNLTRNVEALSLSQTMNAAMSARNDGCALFDNLESYVDQANALNSYGRSSDSPFSTTYNPNWRNHPNLSWRQNQPPVNYGGHQFAAPNPSHPPGFQSHSQFPAPQKKPTLEDTLQQFMQTTQQSLLGAQQSILKLETQVGQLVTVIGEREKEKLPSQPVPNPKGQYEVTNPDRSLEEAKSITTLRSGREIDNQVNGSSEKKIEEKPTPKESKEHDTPITPYIPKAPFPHRLVPVKKCTPYNKILEVFAIS